MSPTDKPSQILLLSTPRSACHLLERMLSKQPGLKILWHPFAIARRAQVQMMQEDSVAHGIPSNIRVDYAKAVDTGIEAWRSSLKAAQDSGETLFVHSHPHFALDPEKALQYLKTLNPAPHNFTLMPSDLLLHPGTVPLLTIRHPALTGPAAYKAMSQLEASANKSNFITSTNPSYQRQMYDYFMANGITPVVAEADDYMGSEEFVKQLARQIGLSPEHCIFKWEKATEQEIKGMLPMYVKLQQTLLNSEGMVKSKVTKQDPYLDVEKEKWRQLYGEEAAKLIEDIVDRGMEDWLYLRERKLRLPS